MKLDDAMAVLITAGLIVLWFLLMERVEATPLKQRGGLECPDTKQHRVICAPGAPDVLLTCPKWAGLVSNAQSLGPQRALMIFRNYIKDRHPSERRYLTLFAQDASKFVMKRQFKTPEQAYATAMMACGEWAGT